MRLMDRRRGKPPFRRRNGANRLPAITIANRFQALRHEITDVHFNSVSSDDDDDEESAGIEQNPDLVVNDSSSLRTPPRGTSSPTSMFSWSDTIDEEEEEEEEEEVEGSRSVEKDRRNAVQCAASNEDEIDEDDGTDQREGETRGINRNKE
ncbi:uncharacterized protein G2W53_013304 [Senna tora]|uniref:Uncharacterized protein n=1 Tax=Senna tora TaxID=362788 RepID=A0A834U1P7_9FABA|nr:uncharacterized protein G2W53_013304 [Senna tora]